MSGAFTLRKGIKKPSTCWDGVIKALLPVGLWRTVLRRRRLLQLLRKLWQERGRGRRRGRGLDDGGLHGLGLEMERELWWW